MSNITNDRYYKQIKLHFMHFYFSSFQWLDMLLTWQTFIVFLLSHKNRINCLAKVVALTYPGIKNCVLLRHAHYFGFVWCSKFVKNIKIWTTCFFDYHSHVVMLSILNFPNLNLIFINKIALAFKHYLKSPDCKSPFCKNN